MPKSQEVESSRPRAFQALIQRMSMSADIDSTEQSGSTESTVEKIVTAETEEDMWDADELGLIGGRNIVDVEMKVVSFLTRFSNSKVGPDGEAISSKFIDAAGRGMYLLITSVRLDTGEEFTWNTSAPSVVSKLYWLDENNRLPKDCVIRGKDLGGGQTYLTLKPVPKRAVS